MTENILDEQETNNKLPSGWVETTLASCLDKIIDYRGKTPQKANSGILTLSAKSVKMGFIDYSQAYFISLETYKKFMVRGFPQKGDILMTTEAPLGCIAQLNRDEVAIAQRLILLRGNENILANKYLMYYLTSEKGQHELLSRASGSTVEGIKRSEFEKVMILLPPLPEQKAIASVLSAFDDKIELLREENKTLEEIGKTIFNEWFGKYGVDDELPEGWRVGKLSEIADFINGLALQKFPPENEYDYLPVVKIRELKAGVTNQTDKASNKIDPKYIVNDGDVLFSWSGSLEVTIWKYGQGALNQHLFKVISKKYPKWFYYMWNLHHLPEFKEIAANKATTMGHIQRHHLDQAHVIIPDNATFQELDKQISPLFEKIIMINKEIQSLTRTRDEILSSLISGSVRVEGF